MKTSVCFRTALLTLLGSSLLAPADIITDWNKSALAKIRAARTSPPEASRNLAILHIAMYDAVNGVKTPHQKRYNPYVIGRHGHPLADETAAASAAARTVLNALWPGEPRFDLEYQAIIASIPEGKNNSKSRGITYGEMAAAAILAARANDGSSDVVPYTQPPAPGIWRPTISFGGIVRPALLPGWGSVDTFGVKSAQDYRPPGPPALHTVQYAQEVNQAKDLGRRDSTVRTADQTEIALYWSNGPGSATPPGYWNVIAGIISEDHGLSMNENARLFALLNIALADAAIVCWDCKYAYNLWRPITAIQEADAAGNAAVVQDPAWVPLLATPPFPEYTSGHSTFSGAAAAVLSLYFGTDELPFTAPSDEFPAIVRSYDSVIDAAEESGMSRIFGGIHYMSANHYGLDAGAAIGEYVATHLLRHRK